MEIVKKHSATFPSDDADINLCKQKRTVFFKAD